MRYFVYLFFLPFVLAGLGVAGYGLFVLRQAARSSAWPSTDGQIVKSEVACNDGCYAPQIVYSYAVDGQGFHGSEIGFGNRISSSDIRHASEHCGKYPAEAKVNVYYDPDDPQTAVLEPGITKKSWLGLAFGLGFALFGAWFCLIFWLSDF
jgi:hypothetical protein